MSLEDLSHTAHESHQSLPFWTEARELGPVTLFGEPHPAGMRIHSDSERYRGRREIVPLAQPEGIRDYLLVHAGIVHRPIPVAASLSPAPVARVSAGNDGFERIGDGQAWYYQAERLVVLWEFMLFPRYRQFDPSRDRALNALWQSFEQLLIDRFGADRIVTPSFEPEYEPYQWEHFLEQRGYRATDYQAFAKEVRSRP